MARQRSAGVCCPVHLALCALLDMCCASFAHLHGFSQLLTCTKQPRLSNQCVQVASLDRVTEALTKEVVLFRDLQRAQGEEVRLSFNHCF